MKALHITSEEVIWLAQTMFLKDHYWIAYNSFTYDLGERDVYFFRSKQEAYDFAEDKVCEYDNFKVIYATSIRDLIAQLSDGNSIDFRINNIENSLKARVMNEENLNDLKHSLKYMGFGDKLCADLEHNIRQGFPEFVLKMESKFGKSKLESVLYFSRSKETGDYSFNHHDAKLKNDVGTLRQTFYAIQGYDVSLKEAFNLLEGRAVHKEVTTRKGETFHAWLQLDFKNKEEDGNYRVMQFSSVHDFDLEATMAKFPIKEMAGEECKRIVISLQKGNLQPVTMKIEGEEHRLFVQANPGYKTLTIFDYSAIRPLRNEQVAALMIPEARQKLNGKEVAIEGEQQGKEMKQDTNGVKQTNVKKNADSFLPKTRVRKKKGLTAH